MLKLFNRWHINLPLALVANYIVASIYGFLTTCNKVSPYELVNAPWFFLAVITGMLFILGLQLYAVSARVAGVAISGMAGRMSLIIPAIAGFLLFGEPMGILRISGIVFGIAALFLTLHGKGEGLRNRKLVYIPLFLLVILGTNDLLLKLAQHLYFGEDISCFLASVFFFALLTGLIFMAATLRKSPIRLADVTAGIALGIINWYSGYFLLRGMQQMDVSVVVPMVSMGVVVISVLAGRLFFNERLSRMNYIGVGMVLGAIVLLSSFSDV